MIDDLLRVVARILSISTASGGLDWWLTQSSSIKFKVSELTIEATSIRHFSGHSLKPSQIWNRSLAKYAVYIGIYSVSVRRYISISILTSTLSTLLAHPTTFMPCWTSVRATAAPIPTEAPVTRATLPSQRSIISGSDTDLWKYEVGYFIQTLDSAKLTTSARFRIVRGSISLKSILTNHFS